MCPADDSSDAMLALKSRVLRQAFSHAKTIDAEAVTVLQHHGLLEDARPVKAPEAAVEVLRNADSVHTFRLGPGPIVAWKAGETSVLLVPLTDFLLDIDPAVRAAACGYFGRICAENRDVVTARTLAIFRAREAGITGETWRPSAIAVVRALKDDFLFNLHGFLQARHPGAEEWRKEYRSKVLSPKPSAVEAIVDPEFLDSVHRAEFVGTAVREILDASQSLLEAFERYVESFGFLPMAPPISAGALFRGWVAKGHGLQGAWDGLWNWASSAWNETASYHLARAYLEHPEAVGTNTHDFWIKISEILSKIRSDWKWKTRAELARHYAHHLESELPGRDGGRISIFAAKIADVVLRQPQEVLADLLNASTDDEWDAPARSAYFWEMFRPRVDNSSAGLRFATLHLRSFWSLGLVNRLDVAIAQQGERPPAESRRVISDVFAGHLLTGFPALMERRSGAEFAFEEDPLGACEKWLGGLEPDERRPLSDVAEIARKVSDRAALLDLLKRVGSGEVADDLVVLYAVRTIAFCGEAPSELLEKWIAHDGHVEAFLKCTDECLSLAIDALLEAATRERSMWAPHLCHLIATAYLAGSLEAKQRKRDLFGALVLCSIATDSVGAIRRLLAEKQPDIQAEAAGWRGRLLETALGAPLASRARLAAVVSALAD